MKIETRKRKQLEEVKRWLAKARPRIEMRCLEQGWLPEFTLLIAIEQVVKYLEIDDLAKNKEKGSNEND